MSTNDFIYNQHEENSAWISKLDFYRDELKILQDRLEEIATKNNQGEVLPEIEKYQNQFIVQRNNIDEIRHQIRENEQALQEEIKSNPVAVDHRKVAYHEEEKNAVESFEHVFNELREDFNKFSSKWM